ncbi:MAG: hypothetical protein ACD_48C00626G0004 [uncultured bacterium]|nr:MAG: hypothetical protein ACD_48C00626G0004 [uncultured bacterium]
MLQIFTIIIVSIALWMTPVKQTFAQFCPGLQIEVGGQVINDKNNIPNGEPITFKILNIGTNYERDTTGKFSLLNKPAPYTSAGDYVSVTLQPGDGLYTPGKSQTINLFYCTGFCLNSETLCTDQFLISTTANASCNIKNDPETPAVKDNLITVKTTNSGSTTQAFKLCYDGPVIPNSYVGMMDASTNQFPVQNQFQVQNHGVGSYKLWAIDQSNLFCLENVTTYCSKTFEVTTTGGTVISNQLTDLCAFAKGEKYKACADDCIDNAENPGVWTAIGCVHYSLSGFVKDILPFAMGIGGGIAFLLMLIGALQIMTSAGNPEKLNAGKELVTSAIVGLLLIIFSVFLLKLIGADILRVPGFE